MRRIVESRSHTRPLACLKRFITLTCLQVLYPETLKQVGAALMLEDGRRGQLQIVTGFLGRGKSTGEIAKGFLR